MFALSLSGIETVLYRFKGYPHDGGDPIGPLLAVNGVLYGTTWFGGGGACADYRGCGTVFSMKTSGKERVLHSFKGAPDGYNPGGGLFYEGSELYGTTVAGGNSTNCPGIWRLRYLF